MQERTTTTGSGSGGVASTAAGIDMVDVDKTYPGSAVKALDDFTLHIDPGELVVLLGGSGCGKSTALRSLAGLEDIQAGRILVAGDDVTGVPVNRRNMAMVFQQYSLFPHMTALENVEFGLEAHGIAKRDRRSLAMGRLELVGLSELADRYTQRMSGGQQQRVALARALAVSPRVLLLDEPLSALDAKVRVQLRDEIRRIQKETGTTTVFVTHDQEEALAIADRIGVMNHGRIEQIDAPERLYRRPATEYVATFVGLTSRIPCVCEAGFASAFGRRVPLLPGSTNHGPAELLVRPEALEMVADAGSVPRRPGARGRVAAVHFLGALVRFDVLVAADDAYLPESSDPVRVTVQMASDDAAAGVHAGDEVYVAPSGIPSLAVPADRR
ncbi:ABC transporter ATP-binding protein [uncultured Bifidobacterium sp.]|uniref:ABC transporter ATP-binding protein n=1 Tax=uncultured Bifidobacterium sp. TaxID=165187 RepID=UPI0028DC1629|nr:ABC transporter ATP-binding protein [uncultured Bifidobacterium sp.]